MGYQLLAMPETPFAAPSRAAPTRAPPAPTLRPTACIACIPVKPSTGQEQAAENPFKCSECCKQHRHDSVRWQSLAVPTASLIVLDAAGAACCCNGSCCCWWRGVVRAHCRETSMNLHFQTAEGLEPKKKLALGTVQSAI